MIKSLTAIFEKVSLLSDSAQELLAEQLNDDLKNESRWDTAFEDSQPALEKMANKAIDQMNRGLTIPKGFDEL